jgi:aspartate aminotransferase
MIIDSAVGQSKTLQFSLKAQELKKQGRDIISLGLGEPDFDTPDHIKQAAIAALMAGETRYSAAPGLPELRKLIAEKLLNDNAIPAKPEEIIVTPGAKNALFVACAAVLHPGDEVINITPCYVSNLPIIKIAEPLTIVHNISLSVTNSFKLDREKLDAVWSEKTKLIIINYPNNPTGKMIDADDFEYIINMTEKFGNYILSDEIYEKLILSDAKHLSPASIDSVRDKVITVNGFSKSYSMTGWRIGYTHAPAAITRIINNIHQQLNTNTAAFIQRGAIAALTGPQDHLTEFCARLKENAVVIKNMAQKHNIPFSPIDGGFFAFISTASTGLKSDDFATKLLDETGAAVIPGVSFGEDFDDWVRISLTATGNQFADGVQRIDSFMQKHGG